ncbi:MAG: MATE family efflux transporter [Hungatella sp.]
MEAQLSWKKRRTFVFAGTDLPALLKFAIPILMALFLQALYGAVDLWAVGRFCGEADISAVSTGSQTMLIITSMITGLSMGTTILLGQRLGEKNYEGAANVIGSSLWVYLILSVILTTITLAAAPVIAEVMHTPAESYEKTISYIRICGGGTIFIVLYNGLTAIFRGMGNSKAPLFFVLIACLVNVVGDLVLICIFDMGTAGAAIATIGAQAVSVLLSVWLVCRNGLPFPFSKKNLRLDGKTAKKVIKLGSPIGLQGMCNEISYLILIGLVNTLGVTASAGVGIAERLVMFIVLIPTSYMSAISAFVAQNIGAASKGTEIHGVGMSTWPFWEDHGVSGIFHGDMLSSIFVQDQEVIKCLCGISESDNKVFILSIAYSLPVITMGLERQHLSWQKG